MSSSPSAQRPRRYTFHRTESTNKPYRILDALVPTWRSVALGLEGAISEFQGRATELSPTEYEDPDINEDRLKRELKSCRLVRDFYDPAMQPGFRKDPDDPAGFAFNIYEPPAYRSSKAKISQDRVAAVDGFFLGLLNNDATQLEAWKDHLAMILNGRRGVVIPLMIGAAGIGKGVAGAIIQALVGPSNYRLIDKEALTAHFNENIQNVQVLFFDEANTSKVIDEIKRLANSTSILRGKYVSDRVVTNHQNMFITSNEERSVTIMSKERRFWPLDLTTVPLAMRREAMGHGGSIDESLGKYCKLLLDPETVESYAKHLLQNYAGKICVTIPTKGQQYSKMVLRQSLEDSWFACVLEHVMAERGPEGVMEQSYVPILELSRIPGIPRLNTSTIKEKIDLYNEAYERGTEEYAFLPQLKYVAAGSEPEVVQNSIFVGKIPSRTKGNVTNLRMQRFPSRKRGKYND